MEGCSDFLSQKFSDRRAVQAHQEETAQEILAQCGGKLDMLVVPVETGALITGLARALKKTLPSLQVVGVIPEGSFLYSGDEKLADIGLYKMEGLGSQYQPPLLEKSLVDSWISVKDADVFPLTRRLISKEGILAGSSGGAALQGALISGLSLKKGARCVLLFPDSARAYTSTLLK